MARLPNIIVFMLDTARASDVYGNRSLTNISRLANHGVYYKNAISPGTWTAPSHASMFSGKHVSKIGAASRNMLSNGTFKIDPWFVKTKFLPDQTDTIASYLSSKGYSTVLMSNNPFVNRFTNLSIGFNHTYDLWSKTNMSKRTLFRDKVVSLLEKGSSARVKMMDASYAVARLMPKPVLDHIYLDLRIRMDRGVAKADRTYMLDRGASYTNSVLKGHLKSNGYSNIIPSFFFINYIEAHENYPVRNKEIIQDKWLYLSGIREFSEDIRAELHRGYMRRLKYLDSKVGSALEILRNGGVLDDAIVIITSDHGQFFGEHGMLYHSQPPYSGVSNVPLISTRYKDGKAVRESKRIDRPVSLTYLPRAISDMLKRGSTNLNGSMFGNVFSEHTGISEGWDEYLLRKLSSRSKYADMIYKAKMRYNRRAVAIYTDRFKLMHFYGAKRDEMYSIDDENEESDILSRNRSEATNTLSAYRTRVGG